VSDALVAAIILVVAYPLWLLAPQWTRLTVRFTRPRFLVEAFGDAPTYFLRGGILLVAIIAAANLIRDLVVALF
jgi:hypothetical protein